MGCMKLLCLSNGHGEDLIALRILDQLQHQVPSLELAALPLVGEGRAYTQHDIAVIGPVKRLPSGGFIYMDGRQLARDVQGGLLQLTLKQLRTVKTWASQGGAILAVGDIVPLLFAWWSGAPYSFVGTAKSDYYLRDEEGPLPRPTWFERLEGWSGSVYLPWERWLMSRRRCRAVFPRDRLTATRLKRWPIPVFDLGNPMMDGLDPTDNALALPQEDVLTVVLLPGSRPPEAYNNWSLIGQAVAELVTHLPQRLLFLGAIAPGLDLARLQTTLEADGWRPDPDHPPEHASASERPMRLTQGRATLLLSQHAFSDCLQRADLAIAMAGTATEQFVGLGKPALILAGGGPQFTPAFAEAQTRLLGPSVILLKTPRQAVTVVRSLLDNPDYLQIIAENGRRRMGEPGAAYRIATTLVERLPLG